MEKLPRGVAMALALVAVCLGLMGACSTMDDQGAVNDDGTRAAQSTCTCDVQKYNIVAKCPGTSQAATINIIDVTDADYRIFQSSKSVELGQVKQATSAGVTVQLDPSRIYEFTASCGPYYGIERGQLYVIAADNKIVVEATNSI